MRSAVGEVDKERFILLVFDVIKCPVGEVINDKSFTGNDLPIVFQHGGVIVTPVTGTEAVILIDATGIGMVGWLHAIVPLAERGGIVAGGLERLEDRAFIQVHALLATAG